jgi:hypothetical protein
VASAPPTEPPKGVPDDEVGSLYRGPLEAFTGARNELAKALRADGEQKAADWVKGLKKPSRAAWLVNQLPERKPDLVKRLLEVGEELRGLQEKLIAGSADPEELRGAARREQDAVDELLKCAAEIGREHGVGGQILERVGETLQAASADPDVSRAIERGRLEREQRASGLGLAGAGAGAASTRGGGPRRSSKGRSGPTAAEREARRQAARRRKQAERDLAAAQKRLERERAALCRAQEKVEGQGVRVSEAEDEVAAAKRALRESPA